MTVTIYKDSNANAIFIEDSNGAQFLNSLQATSDGLTCTVNDLARDIEIISAAQYDDFLDEAGNLYGNNATEVCNALNAIFVASGTPLTNIPEITSSLTATIVAGETLNYELTANYGVGYEWDLTNVPGITTVDGNVRLLIGGSSLAEGTYNIPVKAINYNGEDSETIVLTVSTPPFANTKSVRFNNQDYLGANASLLSGVLGRTGNGSGASDAWTISFWFNPSTASQGQTIFYFGDNDVANSGYINLRYLGSTDKIRLQYGTNNNYVRFQSANVSLPANTWAHVLISYDGGTTGAASGSLNDYYSRFKVFIDGVNVISAGAWSHRNYGYTGSIDSDNLRVGRFNSGNYMRDNCKIDELAIWDSDQSANVSDIYNSGTPFDLSTLTNGPTHWWRMGDGDTYPNLEDNGSSANCTFIMYNMTSADIVSDVP